MSKLSSAPLLFGLSAILLVGLLFGGVWYAVKYNDDQARNNVIAESAGQSSQVLPGDEKKSSDNDEQNKQPAEEKKPAQGAQTPTPAPKPTQSTPKPAPAPTPPKSPPPVVATTGPAQIPAAGADMSDVIATGVMIGVAAFLITRLRGQRLQLRAFR